MLVLALTVAAAILLGHGYLTESRDEVIAAGVASLLGVAVVILDRFRSGGRSAGSGAADDAAAWVDEELDAGAAEAVPAPVAERDDGRVVFVPGRTSFHRSDCGAVAGKQTSAADRTELERGGMQPCRRCIPETPGSDAERTLRLA
jgi:hypothetical protein